MKRALTKQQEIERSIIKKYRKEIWKRFLSAIHAYQLIQPGDQIAVCISGGKDSFLLAKCFQELHKHSDFDFGLQFLCMNPGYNSENAALIQQNAALMDIPLHTFHTDIFDVVFEEEHSPCYLCARMRRGYLYKNARALGCNKIALGHHFDDIIETILMSMLYGGEMRTMMPKLHSTNFPGMELIRPLYMVREADIVAWAAYNELSFLRCACRFTEKQEGDDEGKRQEMKRLIAQLRQTNSYIESNIFRSAQNVNVDAVIGHKRGDGSRHHFLDDYDNHAGRYQDE